jgi:hypothetical protein
MSLVRADALLLAYSQLAIIEAMTQGESRNEAEDDAWALYYMQLAPEESIADDAPPLKRADEEMRAAALRGDRAEAWRLMRVFREVASVSKRYSRNCLARSVALNAMLLQEPEEKGIEFDSVELERVIWLLEAVRRVAEGQEYLGAARAAHDASLNKPRQKRRPVENDWLAEQVTASLNAIWSALGRPNPRPTWFFPKGGD